MGVHKLLLTVALLAVASPAAAGTIWLDPNVRVAEGQALTVTIEGLARGQKAQVTIQESCGRGGPRRTAKCPALWGPVETAAQGEAPGLRHTIAPASLAGLPRDRILWVVVDVSGWPRPAISQFHRADPCSVLATLVQTFAGGTCDLALPQVLSELTRGADGLAGTTFEVHRRRIDDKDSTPVHGTRGATGVAWRGQDKLIITSAAGLLEVDPATGADRVLWRPDERGLPLTAPIVLPGIRGRIAFVQQTPGPQRLGDPEPTAELVIWPSLRRIVLPYKIHQILASDRRGTRLLALSLGLDDSAPLLLDIDLRIGAFDVLGFDNRIYQTLLREPKRGSRRAAVAFEEVQSGRWRIGLARGAAYESDLAAFPDRHALAPAWRPGGDVLAYLVQVN